MRILYITTIGSTMDFFTGLIKELVDSGHTVDIACNDTFSPVNRFYTDIGCRVHTISCSRSPLKRDNISAIKQIRALVNQTHYDIVHCHTPIAAACARIACRKVRKAATKVYYTAHGFHFYKGAPLFNWLLYYPIEKLCSYMTDKIITINSEDFTFAKKHFKPACIEYVPGVGVDIPKFADTQTDKVKKRLETGISDDSFVLISVGELNKNKNHETILRALALINNPSVHYLIAGKGELHDYLKELADTLGIGNRVHLLGFRDDIAELYKASDVCVFPSIREGLGLAAIEAMACGLPLIVSDNRGSRDFAKNNENALVCPAFDVQAFSEAIKRLSSDNQLYLNMANTNIVLAQKFSSDIVNKRMVQLYTNQRG